MNMQNPKPYRRRAMEVDKPEEAHVQHEQQPPEGFGILGFDNTVVEDHGNLWLG